MPLTSPSRPIQCSSEIKKGPNGPREDTHSTYLSGKGSVENRKACRQIEAVTDLLQALSGPQEKAEHPIRNGGAG